MFLLLLNLVKVLGLIILVMVMFGVILLLYVLIRTIIEVLRKK